MIHEFLNFLRAFRFPVFSLDGDGKHGGGSIRALYAGSPALRHYLTSIVYVGQPQCRYLGKSTIFGIRRLIEDGDYDIEFVRGHFLLQYSGLYSGHRFLPEWVSGNANLEEQAARETSSRSRQRDRRLIDKHDMDYAIRRDPESLDAFYDQMYRPHVRSAHGAAALLMDREKMMRLAANSDAELVLIRAGGHPVAGSFIVYERGQPRLYSGGVRDRNPFYLRQGAGSAIYLFSLDYLAKQGYSTVDLGRSRAFLSDGALYFKQRFGLQITGASPIGVFLRPLSARPGICRFLQNTGFIAGHRTGLQVLLYADSRDPGGREKLKAKASQAADLGLREVDIVDLPGTANPEPYLTSKVNVAHRDS